MPPAPLPRRPWRRSPELAPSRSADRAGGWRRRACHTGPVTWLLTIVGIVALIVLHELGHFAVAKAVGMRAERFSLFFPPRLVGVRRGETEYMIGAIPAGGYVKITGMGPHERDQVDLRVSHRAYYMAPPWKRIAVILAGPGVNLLIALALFWVVLVGGNFNGANLLMSLNPSIATLQSTDTVQAVQKKAPAEGALRPGDRIVAVDGRHVSGVQAVQRATDSHRCAGRQVDGCRALTPVHISVRRGGQTAEVVVYPRYSAEARRMLVGFYFGARVTQYGPLAALGTAGHEMWNTTTTLVTNLGRAFTNEEKRKEISSIVGITEATQRAFSSSAGRAMVVLGFVSLALAVINLFPFLPLDGGHVLWAVAEKVRGRRVSLSAMMRFSSVGIVLLAFLVINGFANDISRLTA